MSYTAEVTKRPAILIFPSPPANTTFSMLPATRDALAAATSTLSVDAQKRAEKDALKKASKASAAEAKQQEVLAASKVRIKRVERNKRKYVTEVQGLDAFGLELKKVAKEFGSKFATGSSVTKVAGGGQEITVQGDLSMEIKEFILGKWKDVPAKNIVLEEPKKKKAADAEG
ncbi:Translation machinery-associated protein 22 [Clarireedia jacksonii]